jgi:multidrug efflux pump subunit AcrB
VEFAHHLMKEGQEVREAVIQSCTIRLRPILMTTLATIIGLLPMALKMGEGSEAYAPLARALVGGACAVTGGDGIYCAGWILFGLWEEGGQGLERPSQ